MPLVEHLRELRNRLAKGMLAIVVVTIAAAFYSQALMEFLSAPVPRCEKGLGETTGGACAVIAYTDLLSPFTTTVKVSLMAGVIIASPIWLYQLWAFVAPGLHKHERKYTYAFVTAAVPLFLGGAALAYTILPISMRVLLGITPDGSANILPMDKILDFTVRMVLIFGAAFELPLLLIMLNLTGIVTGRRMLGWWRGVVMGVFVFGAVATPTTDPVGMIALAGPIVVLYFMAVAFSLLNDKRRRRANPDAELDDDEASKLDLTPEDVGEIESVSSARSLPAQASSDRDRVNGYDDIT
ncbi:twin-arginine translocase subunit TatC [Streptomyces sp. NBC_00257]|uniref:twin-arginine translocase subunit TatC n=1 Tax=unclassified Streptomyces TaxID=2593676 RepID=UPI00225813F8|nr:MULTISPECIES: twin-arginine translocase subunit TatC [unclassified Streptomyces]WTB59600.1 twin-arginine translocase subunit TatC [Streptomyces sp. NBC_00826]WTH95818.1 twin-arginine translocase subunit TatC [Streptomyces sp. NBC_00825]WTI04539.1 twin-arginine translocase subunit TatC [Streptomyces sp. NBC_00822]MCX4868159.1 twin-arginine translocase subunit TatC [Streptomyces sp. NBC_00906]MCX4899397.1 twin-arginine translocase subunit TatC [Streptomyces sp. NBC_00892]